MARVPQNPTPQCSTHNGLPDSTCTPGKARTQDVNTICHGGSTKLIRPPVEYTDALKVAQITQYGFGDVSTADYEEDRFVPLEIGGHPDGPQNLWPEPHDRKYGSQQKDKGKDWLHKQICSGAMTPQQAQDGIRANWEQYLPHATPYVAPKVHEVE
jgi:hypothetical protein